MPRRLRSRRLAGATRDRVREIVRDRLGVELRTGMLAGQTNGGFDFARIENRVAGRIVELVTERMIEAAHEVTGPALRERLGDVVREALSGTGGLDGSERGISRVRDWMEPEITGRVMTGVRDHLRTAVREQIEIVVRELGGTFRAAIEQQHGAQFDPERVFALMHERLGSLIEQRLGEVIGDRLREIVRDGIGDAVRTRLDDAVRAAWFGHVPGAAWSGGGSPWPQAALWPRGGPWGSSGANAGPGMAFGFGPSGFGPSVPGPYGAYGAPGGMFGHRGSFAFPGSSLQEVPALRDQIHDAIRHRVGETFRTRIASMMKQQLESVLRDQLGTVVCTSLTEQKVLGGFDPDQFADSVRSRLITALQERMIDAARASLHEHREGLQDAIRWAVTQYSREVPRYAGYSSALD